MFFRQLGEPLHDRSCISLLICGGYSTERVAPLCEVQAIAKAEVGSARIYRPWWPYDDPNSVFWTYVPFDQFTSESGLDIPRYVAAIKRAFASLIDLRPAIDEFLGNCEPGSHAPQETADLHVIAFLDTETTGLDASAEIIELAILNAACDPVTGEVLGILEQYVGNREPTVSAPELAVKASGPTLSFLRGKSLDEDRVRNMLARADCIVAHNAPFDCRMLTAIVFLGRAA